MYTNVAYSCATENSEGMDILMCMHACVHVSLILTN